MTLAATIALFTLLGSKAPSCVPVSPTEPICAATSDCEGLPHVSCDGTWGCQEGACVWSCEPQKCDKLAKCQDGQVWDPIACACTWPQSGCTADWQCGKGQYCEVGLCPDPMPCEPGKLCPPTPACIGSCKDLPPCAAVGPCAPGMVMDPVTCECLPENKGCYASNECGEGFHCSVDDGVCGSPPGCKDGTGGCPAVCYGQCTANSVASFCYASIQCGPGTHCSVDDGVCVSPPGCGDGMACPGVCAGQCVPDKPTGCGASGDCPAGQGCMGGQCVAWSGCQTDADCGGGQCMVGCSGSACAPGQPCPPPSCFGSCSKPCVQNQFCPDGTQWDGTLCQCVAILPPGGCNTNADCAGGEMCKPPQACDACLGCPCFGACVPKGPKCKADSECGAGGLKCLYTEPCAKCAGCECWGACG